MLPRKNDIEFENLLQLDHPKYRWSKQSKFKLEHHFQL